MGERTKTRRRVLTFLAGTVVLLGGLLIIADWPAILDVIGKADWILLVPALAMTAISYACLGYSFAEVSHLLDIPIGRNRLAAIGFVSSVLNHLVQSGGVVGYGVRYALMQRERVPLNDVLAASILHFYLTSLAMQAILPLGFLYLFSHAELSRAVSIAFGAATLILIVIFIVESLLVFRSQSRRSLLSGIGWIVKRIVRKDLQPGLADFDAAIDAGNRRNEPTAKVCHRDRTSGPRRLVWERPGPGILLRSPGFPAHSRSAFHRIRNRHHGRRAFCPPGRYRCARRIDGSRVHAAWSRF